MSSDIENTKEEELREKKPLYKRALEYWQIGFKIIELIICSACIGFMYDPAKITGLGKSHLHHVGIMYTAYTGYMLINCVLLIGRGIRDRIPYRTVAIFAVSGSVMFLVTGILQVSERSHLIRHYFYHPNMYLLEMMTTSTILAFLNSIVFLADAITIFKTKEDF